MTLATDEARRTSSRWAMLLVVFFTRTSLGFQFQSIAALTPFLIAAFDLSYAQVGLLMGLFMLPGVVIALPGGLLGQRYGSGRVVVAGLGLMVVGGAIVSYSLGFGAAALGRALSGVGGVLVNIMLARMVAEWFRGRELQTAMGVMLSAWPFGMALALAILGPLAAAASWRLAEYVTVAAAGLALALIALGYRDPPLTLSLSPLYHADTGQEDWPGEGGREPVSPSVDRDRPGARGPVRRFTCREPEQSPGPPKPA